MKEVKSEHKSDLNSDEDQESVNDHATDYGSEDMEDPDLTEIKEQVANVQKDVQDIKNMFQIVMNLPNVQAMRLQKHYNIFSKGRRLKGSRQQ
jgi:hypothetical protein